MNAAQTRPVREQTLFVSNLCCAAEEALIRKTLEPLPGIVELQFNLFSHQLNIHHTGDEGVFLDALDEIGMGWTPVVKQSLHPTSKTSTRQITAIAASGLLLLAGEALRFFDAPMPLSFALFGGSIIISGWNVFVKAFRAAVHLTLDINVLMSVAVAGAAALGQFGEGAAVIFLFALSLLIESMSSDRTRHALDSLLRLSPSSALVRSGNGETLRPVGQIHVNEIVIVKPGDRIPLDGIVISGFSTVDQSMITGESVPTVKREDDPVYGGTFNQRGFLEVRVTKTSEDSTLAKITHLVEEAQSKRARMQSYIERFAKYYTPGVFIAAVAVCIIPTLLFGQPFGEWFYRSLVLLVISCPCALLISTPITIVSALTNAARHGILIKGGIHLEDLADVQCIAFDKTGTLTHGRPRITDVRQLNSVNITEIMHIAVALESHSEHPLADAFVEYALAHDVKIEDYQMSGFAAITGRGVRATIDGHTFSLGNHRFAEELGVCSGEVELILEELESRGNTVMVLSGEKEAVGVIAVQDEIRHQGKIAVTSLRELGIRHIAVLSGDGNAGSSHVGSQLSVDEVHAGLLPHDKVAMIQHLQSQYGNVAMVGDGINDAPALAASTVGIAMGGAGSDTALETADVVLMADDLGNLPFAIRLGKKAVSTIRQNVMFALAAKLAFVILGVLGLSSLWFAILADDGVTLLVALNAMKLIRMK